MPPSIQLMYYILVVTVLVLVRCTDSFVNPDDKAYVKSKFIGLKEAVMKIRSTMRMKQVNKRNLVIYHIEDIGLGDYALDLTMNNVKLFVASILHHEPSSLQSAFYLFNVARAKFNPATDLIPKHLSNVAIVEWDVVSSPLHTFLHTLRVLDQEVVSLTDAVFSISSGVRGPLVQFQKAGWIGDFRALLDTSGVGLVGATISCAGIPHVETSAFALRSVLVPLMKLELERYYRRDDRVSVDEFFEQRLTKATLDSNYRIASVYHWKRNNTTVFTNKSCFTSQAAQDDPLADCDISPNDMTFLRWSGEFMGAKGFPCGKGVAMNEKNRRLMQNITETLLALPLPTGLLSKALTPTLPEMLTGGPYAHLYVEYEEELAAFARTAPRAVIPPAK